MYRWIDYILKLTDFNEEIAHEFMRTYNEGEASVKELRVIAIGLVDSQSHWVVTGGRTIS